MVACSLAKFHVPRQPAPDQHHVIPQAWQRFWQPSNGTTTTTKPGLTVAFSNPLPILWDPRTVAVCPNHHRLVHEAIVELMYGGRGSEDPIDAKDVTFGRGHLTRAQATGYLALTRWVEAGGSLQALRDAGEWGAQ